MIKYDQQIDRMKKMGIRWFQGSPRKKKLEPAYEEDATLVSKNFLPLNQIFV